MLCVWLSHSARNRKYRMILNRRYILGWFVFLTALASVAAYYRMFTGFSEYDDEGTMMATVQGYLQGHTLYEEVFSGYGPVYYMYNWAVRTLTATPVTNDVVRMSSIPLWLLASVICALYVFHLTRSLTLASVVHILTFYTLSFFRGEPGHPQELCILLLVCLVAAGPLVS